MLPIQASCRSTSFHRCYWPSYTIAFIVCNGLNYGSEVCKKFRAFLLKNSGSGCVIIISGESMKVKPYSELEVLNDCGGQLSGSLLGSGEVV
jgi:hypothetical protein